MFGNKTTQNDISLPVSACQAVLSDTPYFQLSVKLKSLRSLLYLVCSALVQVFCIGRERRMRSRGVEPAGSCPTLVNNILSAASFYGRPQYRGRQDQAPRSHNSQDSIRDALEVVSYSFLQLLKRPCRTHLLRNGLSLQIRRERPEDRASLL